MQGIAKKSQPNQSPKLVWAEFFGPCRRMIKLFPLINRIAVQYLAIPATTAHSVVARRLSCYFGKSIKSVAQPASPCCQNCPPKPKNIQIVITCRYIGEEEMGKFHPWWSNQPRGKNLWNIAKWSKNCSKKQATPQKLDEIWPTPQFFCNSTLLASKTNRAHVWYRMDIIEKGNRYRFALHAAKY